MTPVEGPQEFEIRPSRSQNLFVIALVIVCLLAALIFIRSTLSLLLLLGVTLLVALQEYRQRKAQRPCYLRFNEKQETIQFREHGQPQIYQKYKLHSTRWFAILRLIDKHKNRSLLLNLDRFRSREAYQDFRFLLQRMERINRRKENAD